MRTVAHWANGTSAGHNQQSRGGSGVPRKIAMNGTVNMPLCDAGWEKSIFAKKDSN
jgi:hypothetical protein